MINPAYPPPLEFFVGVVAGFNQLWALTFETSTPVDYFRDPPDVVKGWIWLPQRNPDIGIAVGLNGYTEFLHTEQVILKAAGCKWSCPHQRFFHVGTGWAPCEYLLNPANKGVPWLRSGTYMHDIEMVFHAIRHSKIPLSHLFYQMKKDGILLNDTPRKKRTVKADPMLAILREGGLL
jgi:hypothetical protein